MMSEKEKRDRFNAIARDLYTKEYLGIDEYGKDKEYEDRLTNAATDYLVSLFSERPIEKGKIISIMNEKQITHKSNILKFILP